MGVGCLGRCMIQARVKTRNHTTLRVKLSEPAGLYLIIILFHQWQQLCQLMQTFVTGEVEGRKGGHMGNIFTISSIYFLRFFWMWPIFKVFIEFVTIFLFFFNVLGVVFLGGRLGKRHVGSWIPHQGSNLHPLHWKVMSSPLDQQGSPCWILL